MNLPPRRLREVLLSNSSLDAGPDVFTIQVWESLVKQQKYSEA